ncbi:hypothetical protein FRC08_017591 [Ceratobasidium sp. 394]|nr:hypothetical protein FRC08_017591 [Ceratobasidium sp. 394]
MMVAVADELAGQGPGVAVGALNEPRFVGKSTLLLEQLARKSLELNGAAGPDKPSKIELTFQMGWDTIIRVFAPRYYPSPDAMLASFRHFFGPEGSSILCARRPPALGPLTSIPTPLSDEESDFLSSPYVAPFYQQGKIKLVDLDPSVQGISSSGVRGGTIEDAEKWCPEGVVRYIREHKLYFWK